MTSLYVLPISEAALLSEEYCRNNFPVRTEKSNQFKNRDDKLRCLGAGALLCGILHINESDISYNEYGKPMVSGKHFSLSHSGEYVVLATSDVNTGVDIETINRKHIDIATRVLMPDELEWLKNKEEKEFFRFWTLKESVMKAEGKGLGMDPSSFSVLPIIRGGYIEIGNNRYFGETMELGNYIISVCSGSNESAFHTLVSLKDL